MWFSAISLETKFFIRSTFKIFFDPFLKKDDMLQIMILIIASLKFKIIIVIRVVWCVYVPQKCMKKEWTKKTDG